MDTLMFRKRIQERAQQGERLTDDEIGFITRGSEELEGAASGDIPDKAQWASKAEQVLRKPANKITTDDARDVTSKEQRAFEKLPASGSVASHVQSVADRNEG